MKVLEKVGDVRAARPDWGRVGLVPTMGYLHEGHLSLIRSARAESDTVVMTLFVNPAQFGPGEDFSRYPRDTDRDLKLAEQAGVDVVFMPAVADVYPRGFDTWVEVGALGQRWEGESRPGHFRGVATVVLKLFQMVQPTAAYFGEKDFQQLQVVKKMVDDFNVPVQIVACPTVREPSGLALSSRNAYLSADRRGRAAVLSRALRAGQALAAEGIRDVEVVYQAMRDVFATEPGAEIDYLAIVDSRTLDPVDRVTRGARIVAAMRYDGIHLIDNIGIQGSSAGTNQAQN
jgi:pantoate--beta-alanine ligase